MATPYYADDTVTLWHGDSLEIPASLPQWDGTPFIEETLTVAAAIARAGTSEEPS